MPATEAMVPARLLEQGQHIRSSTGEVLKVLCSNVEKLSGASGSATVWEITAYAEGKPTRRLLGAPGELFEVVEGPEG